VLLQQQNICKRAALVSHCLFQAMFQEKMNFLAFTNSSEPKLESVFPCRQPTSDCRPAAPLKKTIQRRPEPRELRSNLYIEYRAHSSVELKPSNKPHSAIPIAATSLPIDLHRHDCKMLSSKCLRKQGTAISKALVGAASRLALWPKH